MILHLFNPENDLALANGDPNFMAPASARKLAADLATLPCWWADDADFVWSNAGLIDIDAITSVSPWGWSNQVRMRLLKAGIPDKLLPDESLLLKLRELSHRRISMTVLDFLLSDIHYAYSLPEVPRELFSIESVDALFRTRSQWVLKSPWSSSGKGLCWGGQMNAFNRQRWLQTVLSKMGSVIAEPVYQKLLDFGMAFEVTSEKEVLFVGYSLFETDPKGAYIGNQLLSDRRIEYILLSYVAPQQLVQLQEALCRALKQIVSPFYKGYLGIDMMVCREKNGYMLHPCVEVNLRMTMGIVAHEFYRRHTAGGEGVFRIAYNPQKGALLAWHQKMLLEGSKYDINGRLEGGYRALTPVSEDTHYLAWVKLNTVDEI